MAKIKTCGECGSFKDDMCVSTGRGKVSKDKACRKGFPISEKFSENKELPAIPQEVIDKTPIDINEVVSLFKDSIHVDEDSTITIPLAFTIGNFAPIDCDIMAIIGASGSGKTEMIRSIGDTENQFTYPISSMTSHTFVSGLKNSQDLAPVLRNRLIIIKDFTTILAKNKDEVSGIFADIRDVTDGYIQKIFGSEVGKKEYVDLHSDILLACTNAIEKVNSMNSILGQRIFFFRPQTDPRKARKKAMQNAGKEKEIRTNHHDAVMRLIDQTLKQKADRISTITQCIPEDMKERIGRLCEFLAIVRTHIDRDFKGNMASIPEPELPTRLVKSLCKMVDAHSILYDRLPTLEDEGIAVRLIHDNIPTERELILKVLCQFEEYEPTGKIAMTAKLPTSMTSRVLNDLATLGIIDRIDKVTGCTNTDKWKFSEGEFKTAFLVACHFKIWFMDADKLRGVIRYGVYMEDNVELITYVYQNIYNKYNKEHIHQILTALHIHLTESHPSTLQEQKNNIKVKYATYQPPITTDAGISIPSHDKNDIAEIPVNFAESLVSKGIVVVI